MGFKALGLEACPVANTEEARETLRDGDTENRLIAEELNLCDETKRLAVGI